MKNKKDNIMIIRLCFFYVVNILLYTTVWVDGCDYLALLYKDLEPFRKNRTKLLPSKTLPNTVEIQWSCWKKP